MKSEKLVYGHVLLVMLDENENISFINLEKISDIKGNELRELLKYLKQKEYIIWKTPLHIRYIGGDGNGNFPSTNDDEIKLTPKGMEVVIGERDYFKEAGINQTNIYNGPVAKTSGNNSPIIQINHSQIDVLRQLIEDDGELGKEKKSKLFEILNRFNTLKEGGQNAIELIKSAGVISTKYLSLFLNLLS